jgi:ribose transport system ATP-binding protein
MTSPKEKQKTVPVMECTNIVKEFPGVKALKGIDFTIFEKEIIGLVGENGAGKSTLMKILIGLYKPEEGAIKIKGETVRISDPRDAIMHGIGMVFQEQSLIPNLSVAENIFLCHEAVFKNLGIIRMGKLYREAENQLQMCGFDVNPKATVRDLSSAKKQLVEITRLLWLSKHYNIDNPVLILDEPTTVLIQSEIEQLFERLRCIENEASIIFISHRLEEVLELSSRIVIFKDGEHVIDLDPDSTDEREIENYMVGHDLAKDHYIEIEQIVPSGDVILQIKDLKKNGSFDAISFEVKQGEILSLGGVIGSGKEEICKCIAGIVKADAGEIYVNKKKLHLRTPMDSINAGIGYVPIDRRDEGLALQMDVMSNITLVMLKKQLNGGILRVREEKKTAREWIDRLKIKTPSLSTYVAGLSGGNQQKVVIAKWLASNVQVLILDHPTRGVDVGAKEEIYKRIRDLAKGGLAIILMSDTMEEDIGLCNRMITLRDGKQTNEIVCPPENKPTPVDIIGYMV